MRARALTGVFGCFCGAAIASAQTPPLTLDELQRRAIEHNPSLTQAQSQIELALGRAEQAGLWPNPSIGYTAEEVSRSPTIRGGEHGFFVEQVFPLGGKLRLSRSVHERGADVATAITDAQRLRILNTVRRLYHEALLSARRVNVREQLAALTREAVGVSRQLANVGAADQTDLLDAEIETQLAHLALTETRSLDRRIWAELAHVVGDPSLTSQPLDGDPNRSPKRLNRDTMLAKLLEESPMIRSADAGVERARAVLARAHTESTPDLIVRAGPRYNRELFDPGPSPVGWEAFVDIGVTISLFDRNQGGIRAAHAELARAEDERRRVELTLRARFADQFEQYSLATTQADIYRQEILPRAQEAHQLFVARYREMAAAYPQVLIAQRTLLQATDQYLDTLVDAWQAAVLLEGGLAEGGLEPPSAVK